MAGLIPDGLSDEALADYFDSLRTEREKTRDQVASYREAGIWVPASHCPGCGRWAHTEAGNDTWPDAYWMVTDCAKCGRWEVRGAPLSWIYRGEFTVKKLEGGSSDQQEEAR